MKNKKDLVQKIAELETINDHLSTEIRYLDEITRKLGFAEGLKTLKAAALDLLQQEGYDKDEES